MKCIDILKILVADLLATALNLRHLILILKVESLPINRVFSQSIVIIFLPINSEVDLRIGESMQICIHRKDNSPKPVNHRLTLKERPKVKSENIRRFPAHDLLLVGFILQTSRTNNKQVISTFKFGYCRLTLKEGPKVKSEHIKRFLAHDFL